MCPYSILRCGSLTIVLFLISLGNLFSQELQVALHAEIMGEINGGFYGPEVAFETSLTNSLSFHLSGTAGFGKSGVLISAQPGLRYYFGRNDNQGFFAGAGGKLFFFSEDGDRSLYQDELYAAFVSLGFKSILKENLFLISGASIHKTFGGKNEADVLGIGITVGISYRF